MSLQNMQTHVYFKCTILLCNYIFSKCNWFQMSFTSSLNLIVLSHEYIEFLTSFEFQNEKKLQVFFNMYHN
jgi:hypothetical protein